MLWETTFEIHFSSTVLPCFKVHYCMFCGCCNFVIWFVVHVPPSHAQGSPTTPSVLEMFSLAPTPMCFVYLLFSIPFIWRQIDRALYSCANSKGFVQEKFLEPFQRFQFHDLGEIVTVIREGWDMFDTFCLDTCSFWMDGF